MPDSAGRTHLPALQAPLELAPNLHMSNRLAMSSLTRSRGVPSDMANQAAVDYYSQRASMGLIMSEGTLVSKQGTEWPHVISLYSPAHAAAWKKVTDAVHAKGSIMFAQLWHVGRVAHPDMPLQREFGPVSAPSPIAARGGKFRWLDDAPYVAPEREHPNPRALVEEFRQAAILAKDAGCDGVELHGANGYLCVQFVDKGSNHRTDEWGGSLENRTRFYREAIDALVSVWAADRVGIKLNPCGGYNDVGMEKHDAIESYTAIIDYCVKKGLAYVQLVRFSEDDDWEESPGVMRVKARLDVLGTFGPLIKGSKTKLFLNGELTPDEAEELVSAGKIDVAVFGTLTISNPDFADRILRGRPLNDELGFPADVERFFSFMKSPREGYTDYPTYEQAIERKKAAKTQ